MDSSTNPLPTSSVRGYIISLTPIMKIAFEATFGKVWTDNFSPSVFTLVSKEPENPGQASIFFDTQVELIKLMNKQFRQSYLISDFSKTTEATRAALCNYYMDYIPRLVKVKVSYIAFICPMSSFDALPADKKEKLSAAPLGIHPTFVDALATVNLKRSLDLSQRFVSIL
jgi:hypothetical protein